jgi:hypothetical protein
MTTYRGRRAVTIENQALRVTALEEGGHIAEITDKATGINPLWTPAWPSIEPSAYDRRRFPEYGDGADASLLAGIMGHNLCLDIFGGPSADEAAAGLPVHGEVSTARFAIDAGTTSLAMYTRLAETQLEFERRIDLDDCTLRVRERVTNLSATDRPIGWTEHVTIGPPFLERGRTQFAIPARRSKVFEETFGPADYLVAGAEFDWPSAPRITGGAADLGTYGDAGSSSAYTTHLMDPNRSHAFFIAFSPRHRLAFGYLWRREDFPWLGIWEENHARRGAPWNGQSLTCGLEFGVSPFPETRRAMIDRGRLFGVPTFRWLPARQTVAIEYRVVTQSASALPAATVLFEQDD